MTRLKKFTSLLAILIIVGGSLNAQNLFDLQHARQYADYLMQSQQFKLATMEYERVVFMDPQNSTAKLHLIQSYRMAGSFDQGINTLAKWFPNNSPDSLLAPEWVKLNMLKGNYNELNHYLQTRPNLPEPAIPYYRSGVAMLQNDWHSAESLLHNLDKSSSPNRDLHRLFDQKQNTTYKNKGLALGLSALIPGLGKVYANDWKDGLISLLFVATNGWQAYRGFSKDGIQSVYGWIFAGFTLGFYSSNLYGSWQAANTYNESLNHDLYHEIENSLYGRF